MESIINKIKRVYIIARIKYALYSVRRSYYSRLQYDLIRYGSCCEEKMNYNWWQKIIRRLKRLPTDRRYKNPLDVKY